MLKETIKWNLFFYWFPKKLVTFCPSLTSNCVRPSRNFDEVPSDNGRRLNFHSALVFESYHSFTIIAWTHYNNCSSFNRILLVIQKSRNCHFYWCPSLTHKNCPDSEDWWNFHFLVHDFLQYQYLKLKITIWVETIIKLFFGKALTLLMSVPHVRDGIGSLSALQYFPRSLAIQKQFPGQEGQGEGVGLGG